MNQSIMINQGTMQIIILLFFILLMYMLLIRPQKSKQKKVDNFRANLAVGDEVYTIGGVRGKIVKVSDDTVVLQTGNDKVRMEFARWGIMQYVDPSASAGAVVAEKNSPKEEAADEDAVERKARPKRMGAVKPAEESVGETSPAAAEVAPAADMPETSAATESESGE